MRRFPTYPRVLLVLAAFATLTPIFGGYFMGLLLLIWLVVGRLRQGTKAGDANVDADEGEAERLERAFRYLSRPVHLGALLMIGTHLLAGLLGWAFSEYARPLSEVLRVATHMAVKWTLLWFVLATAMHTALRRGWRPRDIGLWLAFAMVINVVYAFAQRQLGIDWTHGFGAVLGPHRFAYGVYRVSGFMGHPLTLAYNLMLIILAAGALLVPMRQILDTAERRAWLLVAALGVTILMISGSRFVLLVLPAVVVLAEGRRLLPYVKWIAAAVVPLALFLWWEGSIVGRFGEIFDQSVPLTERFSRLIFWQVHWRMFIDHPFYGVTLAGLDEAMQAYYTAIGYHDKMYTAHNVFLQALADSGLIGFSGVIALIGGIGVAARRARELLGHPTGLSYLALATVLSGLMQNNLRDSEYLYALWFFLALLILRAASLAARSTPSGLHEREPPKDLQPTAGRTDSP